MAAAGLESAVPDQGLVFSLGENRFCVGIDTVDEIVRAGEISAIPDSPPMVEGVMNLRGATTVVVDPRVVFDVPVTDTDSRVIIFEADDSSVGWLADEVHWVGDLADHDVEPAPDAQSISGILKRDGTFTLWVDPAVLNDRIAD